MKTQFDIPSLEKFYCQDENYKIIYGQVSSDCRRDIIFFSGNGLYYPNSEDVFRSIIIDNDRYEWENISKSIQNHFRKIIFLRDIKKTWYSEGISEKYPNIDSVCFLLKNLTSDSESLVCVGNSAGGYAALLFGSVLGAKTIFSFSGFVNLSQSICTNPLNPGLKHALGNKNKMKWLDIREIVQSSSSQIFFFFPILSPEDLEQANWLKSSNFLTMIPIDSDVHGIGPSGFVYEILLTTSPNKLKKRFEKISNSLKISELNYLVVKKDNFFSLFNFLKKVRKQISIY